MKLLVLTIAILTYGLTAAAQGSVSLEEKALLERLSRDNSFTFIDRLSSDGYLPEINVPKQKLYKAYLEKSAEVVKVSKKATAGWEGQYTMTWFAVDHGKVRIVEAYFGDPSGSGELQYLREYVPEVITIGHYAKDWQCEPLKDRKIREYQELCISYKVSSEQREKIF